MDEWDLNDPKAQVRLKTWYDEREELKVSYLKTAGEKLKQTNSQQKPSKEKVQSEAWGMCFSEIKEWYERKVSTLDGMRRFHHAVRAGTDGIDIIECGRWKLDLMNRTADEKGLDTRLAVDMVALEDNFDVAVVLSGDADMIPSIDLMKRRSKHVGVFEFIKGYPPENTGRGFSSHLKLSADFVTTIFEMDMVQKKVASKGVLEIDFPKEKDIASESDNNLKETQNADFGVGVNDSQ
jgi:uncharacterized LabA/DUF88 family protein